MGNNLVIVQLSDIHFKIKNNPILVKCDKLFDAIKNEISTSKYLFIVVTGDIANTGLKEEYDVAFDFFKALENKLEKYCNTCNIQFIFTPGNHDCDFSDEDAEEIRDVIIEKVIGAPDEIKSSYISQCTRVQENYFRFIEKFNSYNYVDQELSNLLFTKYEFDVNSKKIVFNSFNVSWLSKRKENQGQLIYPVDNIDIDKLSSSDIDFNISLFHHPFHWLDHLNIRKFRELINNMSDLLFTGHEHTSSGTKINDMNNIYNIQHIEAGALQENNVKKSSFNLFKIDLANNQQEFSKFEWEKDFYDKQIIETSAIIKKQKNGFNMKQSYIEYINKLAIKVNHPYKDNIELSDIFIYPDLKAILLDKEKENVFVEKNASTLKNIDEVKKTIIYGHETSGKSSLLRKLQLHYCQNDYIAIIIDASYIKEDNYKEANLKALILKSFKKEFDVTSGTVSKFEQVSKDKVILLIDGFEKTSLNNEYKGILLKNIEELGYENILISSHENMKFEATTEGKLAEVLKEWNHYAILELGHKLRSKLINQWISLGRESNLEKAALTLKVREQTDSINKTIGYNIIPAYPVYIMTLLQAMEANMSNNLSKSTYGHYYHYLIMDNLQKTKANLEPKDINTIFGFTSSFAFSIFQSKNYIFSLENIKTEEFKYCAAKKFTPSFNIVNTLISASIIVQYDGKYKFTHNYIYYYFVATHFADKHTDPIIEEIIFKMTERLYRTEFANILMFILHLTPKTNIIKRLVVECKKIFSELHEFQFHPDEVKSLNNSIKKDYITCNGNSLEQNHEEKLENDDKAEPIKKQIHKEDRDDADYNESIQELNLFGKINLGFKMMEILGEIIKNYSGTLDGDVKEEMICETHSVGLRTLKSLMVLFEDEHHNIMQLLRNMVEKKNHVTSDKIDEDLAKIVYSIATNISTNVIKKIAKATASKDLKDLITEIFEKDSQNNAKLLLEQAIELDFQNGLNIKQIEILSKQFKDEKNAICNTTLKKLVLEHLYMFDVTFDKKQSICKKLDINIGEAKNKMISMTK